ncbi:MAG TPA: glycosyltransferase family 2 protein [Acidimicrobiia bacterium]|nr:glycosyltransferase family 2 protein [Acidimicrobiia bacterium]
METAEPPVTGPSAPLPADRPEPTESSDPTSVPPPIVALLVAHNPGPWFEETLQSLAESDYPDLAVLVIDAGSDHDLRPRVAAHVPHAFVRRLEANVGFAVAANEALSAVQGATFLLLCHDDVAFDPAAIRLLVEEAYRSNAGVVGPKLVDADRPHVLAEVGLTIDRFGVACSEIEPGELDQEQHDAVRDVFYVSSAAMLVRADLFFELGGFDAETFPGAEDLDLCWRARLMGARVLVAPDARVRHHGAIAERSEATGPDEALVLRHRLRAVFKSYSRATLLWVVPVALLLGFIESAVFVASRRGARARALVSAWIWNLRRFSALRSARREVQSSRRVPDSELRWLQRGGSARVRDYLIDRVQPENRLVSVGTAGRVAVDSARSRLREPLGFIAALFVLVLLFGSREILFGHAPAVGSFLPWPGVGDLLRLFGSGWRAQGLGSAAAPPPVFALQALGTAVVLGASGIARSWFIAALLPLGALGVFRLTRLVAGNRRAALVAALIYGISPIGRNAIAGGRLGALVFFAVAPFALRSVVLLARRPRPDGGWPVIMRSWLPLVASIAVATAFWPPAAFLLIVMVGAFVIAQPLAGDDFPAVRALGVAAVGAVAGLVALVPWPLTLLGAGERGAAWGLGFPARLELGSILRFSTGPAGGGFGGWVLLLAAGLGLLLTTGPRLAWIARAWVLALVGFALAWLPTVVWPDGAVPAPEGLLVPAALGLALAVGLAVGALRTDLHRFHFGWRQVAAAAVPLLLVLPALGFAVDAFDGRWGAPSTDWNQSLSWMTNRDDGGFRVLWVGDPYVLPLDATLTDGGTGYSLARGGPGALSDLWPAPGGPASGLVADAIELARDGRTNRLGHILAPMGVRYVALPPRSGASGGVAARPTPQLARGLADQLDLSRLESDGDLLLYENDAWVPIPAVLPDAALGRLRPGAADPNRAALDTDLSGAQPVLGDGPVVPGAVLQGESYSGQWRATTDDRELRHVDAFGWANGYDLESRGRVSFVFGGQWRRNVVAVLQLVVWIGLAVFWLRSTAFVVRRRERRRARKAERIAARDPAATA